MGRWDSEYWVWRERPGYPHLHAKDFGGESAPTLTAALALVRAYVKDGYIVRIYACERGQRAA